MSRFLVAAALALVAFLGAAALPSDDARAGGLAVRFAAEMECLEAGGARLSLTVRNRGDRALDIKDDFHVTVDRIRAKARKHVAILFVVPAPSHDRIPPGQERTFILPVGDGLDGTPPADLRAKEIRVESEFWFEKHGHAYRRVFSLPGCKRAPAPRNPLW
jgi:hypothetical protein